MVLILCSVSDHRNRSMSIDLCSSRLLHILRNVLVVLRLLEAKIRKEGSFNPNLNGTISFCYVPSWPASGCIEFWQKYSDGDFPAGGI